MKQEELTKKLEKVELPEIKITSHQRQLKVTLLKSRYFEKPGFIEILKRSLVFGLPVLAVFLILGLTVIQPKLTEAKILGIAKNNPEIKKLIEENNMVLNQIKIQDGRAYVLFNRNQAVKEATGENLGIKIKKTASTSLNDEEGAVVEINLKEKHVSKINSIRGNDVAPLDEHEKESAEAIVNAEEVIKKIVPSGAKIEEIKSSLPQNIHLIEKNNKIEVVYQSDDRKEASVHYTLNGEKWVVKVNLEQKRVEEIRYSSDNDDDNDKGRD